MMLAHSLHSGSSQISRYSILSSQRRAHAQSHADCLGEYRQWVCVRGPHADEPDERRGVG